MSSNKIWMLAVTALAGCAPSLSPVANDTTARGVAPRIEPDLRVSRAPLEPKAPAAAAGDHASGGLAAAPAETTDPDVAAVDQNLGRLRALDVFEVGALVAQAPTEDALPYANISTKRAWEAGQRRVAAHRLARFTALAVEAATQPSAGPDSQAPAAVEENLAALRALHVVDVPSLVTVAPEENHFCYGPCPDEIAGRRRRAAALASIAAAVRGGL